MKLATHIQLLPRLRIIGAIPLHPFYEFMSCSGHFGLVRYSVCVHLFVCEKKCFEVKCVMLMTVQTRSLRHNVTHTSCPQLVWASAAAAYDGLPIDGHWALPGPAGPLNPIQSQGQETVELYGLPVSVMSYISQIQCRYVFVIPSVALNVARVPQTVREIVFVFLLLQFRRKKIVLECT